MKSSSSLMIVGAIVIAAYLEAISLGVLLALVLMGII